MPFKDVEKRRAYYREYNKKKYKERRKNPDWVKKHNKSSMLSQRKYRKNHPDRKKESNKKYYLKNKERISNYNKIYYLNHRGRKKWIKQFIQLIQKLLNG